MSEQEKTVEQEARNGQLPDLIELEFLGIPNVKRLYRGDGFFCDTKKPDTCIISATPGKAKQLVEDFPDEWRITGNAAKAQHIKKLLKKYQRQLGELGDGASVKTLEGVAKIIQADGTEIILPPGSRVTIEAAGR